MYPLEEQNRGSFKCGSSKCGICKNVRETDEFTSTSNNVSYKINHHLNCNSNNVVYLLKCKVCNLQYVGQTTNKFRYRWSNYKSCQKKASKGEVVPQSMLHQHFLDQDHHGLDEDCDITLIDRSDATFPLDRENFWITMLKTTSPSGFNVN